jgi:hypothetical protein
MTREELINFGERFLKMSEPKGIAYEFMEEALKLFKQEESVLDKIKAEVEALPKTYPFVNHFDTYVKENDVRKIIDKYKAGGEEKIYERDRDDN